MYACKWNISSASSVSDRPVNKVAEKKVCNQPQPNKTTTTTMFV